MGYELKLLGSEQGNHVTDLCTNGGWSDLCHWADSLPDAYPAVKAFAAMSRYTDTAALADQLNHAIADHPPDPPDVLHTANRLADLLGAGAADETAVVT